MEAMILVLSINNKCTAKATTALEPMYKIFHMEMVTKFLHPKQNI